MFSRRDKEGSRDTATARGTRGTRLEIKLCKRHVSDTPLRIRGRVRDALAVPAVVAGPLPTKLPVCVVSQFAAFGYRKRCPPLGHA